MYIQININDQMNASIHSSWAQLFNDNADDLKAIFNNMNQYDKSLIYPSSDKIFKVFQIDINDINVVLIGQDPYHNKGQANGLSFSVDSGISIPPSLKNIYKELMIEFPDRDYKFEHGNLDRWFNEEKIFLLNSSLTVLDSKPSCFMKLWRNFTDNVIKYIDKNNKKCVFLLLGNFSKSKIKYLSEDTYLNRIVTGVHPSPLSAYNGFFNSYIFKEVEKKLDKKINWNL